MTKPISRLNLPKPNNLEMAKQGKEEIFIYSTFIKKLDIFKRPKVWQTFSRSKK